MKAKPNKKPGWGCSKLTLKMEVVCCIVPPEGWPFSKLYSAITQKTVLFIVNVMRIQCNTILRKKAHDILFPRMSRHYCSNCHNSINNTILGGGGDKKHSLQFQMLLTKDRLSNVHILKVIPILIPQILPLLTTSLSNFPITYNSILYNLIFWIRYSRW
jgi:hypothetical protein